MSNDRHERKYLAYQAIKDLSDLLAETMKQIAYEQMAQIDWDETCCRHRDAFARWIAYADAERDRAKSAPLDGFQGSDLTQQSRNR
ncbi:hypothetical protein [Pseudomonas sp. AP-1]|uniref:hypothetical protein n=1 Tax=Pseudomonas sp. AP-1 TaxID=3231718 RepID=UPI0035AD7C08